MDHFRKGKSALKGFTLIELLIILAIVGVTSAILVTGFSAGQVRREVETASREFASVVREAQGYALSGKRLPAGVDPCLFGVSWSGSSSSYNIVYKDKAGCSSAATTTISGHTLQRGVTFSTATSSFFFTLPHASLSPAPAGGRYAVTMTKSGQSRTVCVYTSGRVADVSGSTCP